MSPVDRVDEGGEGLLALPPLKKRAHKTKLTPELQERIVAFLRAGNYVETASACAGIHKDTFYDGCEIGRRSVAMCLRHPIQ